MKYSKEQLMAAMAKKGFKVYTKGAWNVNIIGVRTVNKTVTNKFDDYLYLLYTDGNSVLQCIEFPATTDPGLSSLSKPMNPKGTAILVPGNYPKSHRIGMHQGKRKALVQSTNLPVYRDNDRDNIYDMCPDTIDKGLFGINIHDAGIDSTLVDGWSAGCQVLKRRKDMATLLSIVDNSASIYGNSFTYTLLVSSDLV